MKIGLIDVDGHNFPNLALMKISTYHKQRGDSVEWVQPLFGEYDIVYQAKVFTFTKDYQSAFNAKYIIKGGTGYNLESELPSEIEHCFPDYDLYNIKDTAYGYLTRGCPRGCPFCIVQKKEGAISKKVADLKEWWNGQKYIKLLDPNILACKDWKQLLKQLVDSKAYIDFTQGLDIRLMTDEKAELINQCKTKMLHFAWDNPEDELTLKMLKKYVNIFKGSYVKKKVYVLTNFNSTIGGDLYRIYELRDLGYDPFVMIYDKQNAPLIIRKLQRWVNNKIIFNSCDDFEEYYE